MSKDIRDNRLCQELLKEFPYIEIDTYESDLLILGGQEVYDYLMNNYKYACNVLMYKSDVEGQPWFGKDMIEIPFAF